MKRLQSRDYSTSAGIHSSSTFTSQPLISMPAESSKKAQKRKSMADATPVSSVRIAEASSSVGPVFGEKQ